MRWLTRRGFDGTLSLLLKAECPAAAFTGGGALAGYAASSLGDKTLATTVVVTSGVVIGLAVLAPLVLLASRLASPTPGRPPGRALQLAALVAQGFVAVPALAVIVVRIEGWLRVWWLAIALLAAVAFVLQLLRASAGASRRDEREASGSERGAPA